MTSSKYGWAVAPNARAAYREVPEREDPYLHGLAKAAQQKLWAASPWRPYVTSVVFTADIPPRRTAASFPDPTVGIAGPTSPIQAYWLRRDHAAPSIPPDPTWTRDDTSLQAAELVARAVVPAELLGDAIEAQAIDLSYDLNVLRYERPDPAFVNLIVEAVLAAENAAFGNGAGSTTDPIRGLTNLTGVTTQAATTAPYLDDLVAAAATLLAAKRRPNAAFVPIGLWKVLRQAKGTTNQYIVPVGEELAIAVAPNYRIPIVPLDGLPSGASVSAFVGDFRQLVAAWRILPNGLFVKVDRSSETPDDFVADRTTLRVIERFGLALVPNQGSAIVKITGINAP